MSQRKLCHKTKELRKKPQTSLPKAPRKTQAPLCPLFTKQMQTNQLKPNFTLGISTGGEMYQTQTS